MDNSNEEGETFSIGNKRLRYDSNEQSDEQSDQTSHDQPKELSSHEKSENTAILKPFVLSQIYCVPIS